MTEDNTTRQLDARYCAEQAAQMIREAHGVMKKGGADWTPAYLQIAEAWRQLGESLAQHSRMRPNA